MNIGKRLKKIEKAIAAIKSEQHEQRVEINDLKREVEGGLIRDLNVFTVGLTPKKKTRIDKAIDGTVRLDKKVDALCESLGLKIRDKDEMPDFDIVKAEKVEVAAD